MGRLDTTSQYADYVAHELLTKGCIVHRYNSFSTNSIYLKVDYGVGGSIRIADHKGKANLNYRFNLLTNKDGDSVKEYNTICDRHFYNSGAIDTLIEDVLKFRMDRMHRYKNYKGVVNTSKNESKTSKGFWESAFEVFADDSEQKEIKSVKHTKPAIEKIIDTQIRRKELSKQTKSDGNIERVYSVDRVSKWLDAHCITFEEMTRITNVVRAHNSSYRNCNWERLDDSLKEQILEEYWKINHKHRNDLTAILDRASEMADKHVDASEVSFKSIDGLEKVVIADKSDKRTKTERQTKTDKLGNIAFKNIDGINDIKFYRDK